VSAPQPVRHRAADTPGPGIAAQVEVYRRSAHRVGDASGLTRLRPLE